jgi:threonine synthase
VGSSNIPRICVATASPAKFEEAVASAGLIPQLTESVKALDTLPTKYVDMNKEDNWEQILRHKMEEIYNRKQ